MSHELTQKQWDKITIWVDRNKFSIEACESDFALNMLMQHGDLGQMLLGDKQRWCDVGDVAEICRMRKIKCPVAPDHLKAPEL